MEIRFTFRKEIEILFLLQLIKTCNKLSKQLHIDSPQELQDNLSIKSNGIDTLKKFIDAAVFNLTQKPTTEKKSDKHQQTQNTKDPILETLQDTIFILRVELVNKKKTIDSLILIIEKTTTGPSNVKARLAPLEE